MSLRSDLLAANAALRLDLATPPGAVSPSRPVARTIPVGSRLPAAVAQTLGDLIRRHPDEPTGRIIARLEQATGVRVSGPSVCARRGPVRICAPTGPLSAREEVVLAELLADHPTATNPRIAALFEAATSRRIMARTVRTRRQPAPRESTPPIPNRGRA